ncbi:MAG: MmcQ/YjbR family DNA-binding protein [Chitinophagales bacterium]
MNIELIRAFILSLPHVKEDIKWENDLCFLIGGKMFCVTGLDSSPFGLSLKVTKEEYDELIEKPGIRPAPYLARYNWIYIEDIDVFNQEQWQYYIQQSYEIVKAKLPKRVIKLLNDE